jgi:hypothetical protein
MHFLDTLGLAYGKNEFDQAFTFLAVRAETALLPSHSEAKQVFSIGVGWINYLIL